MSTCQLVENDDVVVHHPERGKCNSIDSGEIYCQESKMNKKRLANLIREARGDISQRQFAKMIGVSQTSVSDWEKGTYFPNLENAEAIARRLGISLSDFVAQIEDEGKTEFEKIIDSVKLLDWNRLAEIQRAIAERMEGNNGVI